MSGAEVSDERTYGAAIEVPEMVLVAVVEPIQEEVTSTPRYQTGDGQKRRRCDELRGDAPTSAAP